MQLSEIFKVQKPIIGMLHLMGDDKLEILTQAKIEIRQMYEAGVDAVLVENYFGTPADMERALAYLQEHYTDHVYGVNVLGSFRMGFRMARQYGAKFIQIDSICGHLDRERDLDYASDLLELRGNDLFLMGGVRFKYQPVRSKRSLDEDLLIGMERCDGIVVTGEATAVGTDMDKINLFREIMGNYPLIVGAGLTLDTCAEQLSVADAAIVGSWFKKFGITENPVDPRRVELFMEQVQRLRNSVSQSG